MCVLFSAVRGSAQTSNNFNVRWFSTLVYSTQFSILMLKLRNAMLQQWTGAATDKFVLWGRVLRDAQLWHCGCVAVYKWIIIFDVDTVILYGSVLQSHPNMLHVRHSGTLIW